MRNIRWQRAVNSDKATILNLMERYYAFDGIPFDALKSGHTLKALLNNRSFGDIFLILCNEEVAGYCALTNGYSLEHGGVYQFLDELFLLEEFRGVGLGSATLRMVEEMAASNQVTSIHLEVDIENHVAQELYKRRGYVDSARHLWIKKLRD